MSFAKAMTLMSIPHPTAKRKLPLMCFQNLIIFPVRSRRIALVSKEFIEATSSSKMPVMKAIVPPLTPGITSAAPIPIPFSDSMR